jgi:hypothetical protein
MTAYLRIAAAAALLAAATPALALGATLPDASSLPKDVIQLSGVVPGMGEHWANPADMPIGPIYGVSNGKVIFLEFMIDQESFKAGKSFLELASKAGIELPPIDHVDFNFEPHGHEGYEIPHYDIHMYFVPHAEHMAIKP